MKALLNIVLACALSMTIQNAGATPDTWQFWVAVVLICALVGVQYIPW